MGLSFGMLKLLSIPHACFGILCGLALCSSSYLQGQAATSSDPKAILLTAAAANGASSPDAKPWHIKISYTRNAPGAKPAQGTFEAWWAGPTKYKRVFTSSAFNQAEYGTANGPRRTGTADDAPAELQEIVDEFLKPIPFDEASITAAKLEAQPLALGSATLTCVSAVTPASATQPASMTSYCMDQAAPVLRLTVSHEGMTKTARDSIVKFQGRYVAQKVDRYGPPQGPPPRPGTPAPPPSPEFSANIEALEPLATVDDAMFTPPADAAVPPKVIALDEKTTKKQLLQHPIAEYPMMAHWQHVRGVVEVALRVGTDGHVSSVRVLSGPPLLQQATVETISKWTYKPFVVDGQPVQVDTTASMTFTPMP